MRESSKDVADLDTLVPISSLRRSIPPLKPKKLPRILSSHVDATRIGEETSVLQNSQNLPLPLSLRPAPSSSNTLSLDEPTNFGYSGHTPRTPFETPRTPPHALRNRNKHLSNPRGKRGIIANKLLMDLEPSQLHKMHEAFDEHGGNVEANEFSQILEAHIPKGKFTHGLMTSHFHELFDEIDVNGDEEISWEEFTGYVVKNGLVSLNANMYGVLKQYEQTSAGSDITPNAPVEKVKYFPAMNRFIFFEGKDSLNIYKLTDKFEKNLVLMKELKGHAGPVLAADYISASRTLATSAADRTIKLWDLHFRKKEEFTVPRAATSLVSYADQLYIGDIKGGISVWDLTKQKIGTKMQRHTEMVMDMKVLLHPTQLASASMEPIVLLWDPLTGAVVREWKGHTKGIVSLAFSDQHRTLLSASYDREILVWSTQSEFPIVRLRGHHNYPIGVSVSDNSSVAVSGDRDGVFKLWDLRTFECLQTFSANEARSSSIAGFDISSDNTIIAGGRKLFCFEYNKSGLPWLTDDSPLVSVIYSSNTKTIVTTSTREIRIWEASSGLLLRVHKNFTNQPITAATLDSRHRNVICGTAMGHIIIVNYTNGTVVHQAHIHDSEVSALHAGEGNSLVSASWDGHIYLHPDISRLKRRDDHTAYLGNSKDITCAAVSTNLLLVATGSVDNSVIVWDYETSMIEVSFFNVHTSDITSVLFLDPFPILASADNAGWIFLWTVRPSLRRNSVLIKFPNSYEGKRNGTVTCMAFNESDQTLLTGDEYGEIRVWSLSKIFHQAHVLPRTKVLGSKPLSETEFLKLKAEMANLKAEDARLMHSWSAHTAPITSVQVYNSPKILLSASKDNRARAWSHDGVYYGTLRQSPEGGNWSAPAPDPEVQKKQEQEEKQPEKPTIEEQNGQKRQQNSRRRKPLEPDTTSLPSPLLPRISTLSLPSPPPSLSLRKLDRSRSELSVRKSDRAKSDRSFPKLDRAKSEERIPPLSSPSNTPERFQLSRVLSEPAIAASYRLSKALTGV